MSRTNSKGGARAAMPRSRGVSLLAAALTLAASPSLFMLSSCQAPPSKPAGKSALRVEPVMSVTHSRESAQDYYALGRYYDGQNRIEQALNAYRQALERDPQFAEAYNAIGVLYGRQGKLDDAMAAFERAASLAPEAGHVLSNLGHALMLAGRNAEAVNCLRRATAADPKNAKAWGNLATALRRAGFGSDADMALQRSIVLALPAPPAAPVPAPSAPPVPLIASAQAQTLSSHMEAVEVSPNVVELRHAAAASPVVGAAAVSSPAALDSVAAQTAALPTAAPDNDSVPAMPAAQAPGFRLEIANGVGVTGAARRTGAMLSRVGAPAARLVDQRPFVQKQTVIEFARGYEAQAMQVAGWIGTQPLQVSVPGMKPADIRVVVGWDLMPVLAADAAHDSVPDTRLAAALSARAIASLR